MSVLADWLARQAPAWLQGNLTPPQRRALHALQRCRTPALGGHLYRCAKCGKLHHAYHSCHHRACPRCGGAGTAAWTQKQTGRLLPVAYFLVTFTLPAALRPVFAARPELLYDLFFAQAAAALQAVAANPRHLGAVLGMIGVLHTWGCQLQFHPHLHFIVPGGGLQPDRLKWRSSRQPDWLLPQDAVAAALRDGMQEALRAATAGHPQGGSYGHPGTADRYRKAYLRPRTPLPGLFLTGSDALSFGIMGALMGGVLTASLQLRGAGFLRILREARRREACPERSFPARMEADSLAGPGGMDGRPLEFGQGTGHLHHG